MLEEELKPLNCSGLTHEADFISFDADKAVQRLLWQRRKRQAYTNWQGDIPMLMEKTRKTAISELSSSYPTPEELKVASKSLFKCEIGKIDKVPRQ